MIPRFKPALDRRELARLFAPSGGAVERFEREFARSFGAAEAIAFPYGRSALWAFLKAVGVGGAEVVTPAYTCSVVAHAISLSGNTPRFVDIRPTDYNMDLNLLPTAINASTRAVVATHLFGYPLDLDRVEEIVAIAEAEYGHKVWLIQDCAHAFGASWNGRMVGTSGDVALYALNISKTMTSIFGGMLTFQDESIAAKVRNWRDEQFHQPSLLKPWLRRLYLLAAYNAFNETVYGLTYWLQEKTHLLSRLTESYHLDDEIHFPPDCLDKMMDVEAAVGLEQLKKYPDNVAQRRANAIAFDAHSPRPPGWIFPPIVDGATYSHYVIRVPDRKAVVAAMASKKIQLGELIQYSVPKLQSYAMLAADCPVSAEMSRSTVNLPIYPSLGEAKRKRIFDALDSMTRDSNG